MSATPLKVLVVDDEPPIRKLLRLGLSTQGYDILDAPSGKAALELIAQKPDLVILDLGLPDIDGVELLRKIREKQEGVPIVVLSSRGEEAAKVQALLRRRRLRDKAVRSQTTGTSTITSSVSAANPNRVARNTGAAVKMRPIATALDAVMKRCRMLITPTIWSTAACTIHTVAIAMITGHLMWSGRRERRRMVACGSHCRGRAYGAQNV